MDDGTVTTPDALIAPYRAGLARLYGAAYAEATYLEYRRGRFCISLPVRIGETVYAGARAFSHRYHRMALELMVARLASQDGALTEEQ